MVANVNMQHWKNDEQTARALAFANLVAADSQNRTLLLAFAANELLNHKDIRPEALAGLHDLQEEQHTTQLEAMDWDPASQPSSPTAVTKFSIHSEPFAAMAKHPEQSGQGTSPVKVQIDSWNQRLRLQFESQQQSQPPPGPVVSYSGPSPSYAGQFLQCEGQAAPGNISKQKHIAEVEREWTGDPSMEEQLEKVEEPVAKGLGESKWSTASKTQRRGPLQSYQAGCQDGNIQQSYQGQW